MALAHIRAAARRSLHRAMQVPAIYIPPGANTPIYPIQVRVHNRIVRQGEIDGLDFTAATVLEDVPQIILLREDVDWPISRGGVFSVSPGEAYRVDHQMPPDPTTITVRVVRLGAAEAENLPLPGEL